MFYFRLNKVRILKNREVVPFWRKDEAEVELWSFITTDNMPLPNMRDFLRTTDSGRRRVMTAEIVGQVLTARKISPIQHVKDNHVMTFGDTGYVLYETEKIPDNFNWSFLAIELDEQQRDAAKLFRAVVNDPSFTAFSNALPVAIARTPNPAFQATLQVSRFISEVIIKRLKAEKDDLIGILYMSLNRQEHYPHGERKKDDIPDLTNNMWVDYSIFGFE